MGAPLFLNLANKMEVECAIGNNGQGHMKWALTLPVSAKAEKNRTNILSF